MKVLSNSNLTNISGGVHLEEGQVCIEVKFKVVANETFVCENISDDLLSLFEVTLRDDDLLQLTHTETAVVDSEEF